MIGAATLHGKQVDQMGWSNLCEKESRDGASGLYASPATRLPCRENGSLDIGVGLSVGVNAVRRCDACAWLESDSRFAKQLLQG